MRVFSAVWKIARLPNGFMYYASTVRKFVPGCNDHEGEKNGYKDCEKHHIVYDEDDEHRYSCAYISSYMFLICC